jgi:hypothetical protein
VNQKLTPNGKTEIIAARVTVDDLEQIDQLAILLGTDRSKLTRWLISQGLKVFQTTADNREKAAHGE